ncbi:MAG: M15 family metallopeptidase [Clostridia bacterium]|nr:M15 family metallopeptidase [Clostridia bacterium]
MTQRRTRRPKKRLKKAPVIILLLIILGIAVLIFNYCHNTADPNNQTTIIPQNSVTGNSSTESTASQNHYFSTNFLLYSGYDLSEYSIEKEASAIKKYKKVSLQDNQLANGNLILVNTDTSYTDPPLATDLIQVNENKKDCYLVKDNSIYLAPNTLESLNRWLSDAYTLGGIKDIIIWSGYRSLAEQEALYKENTGEAESETTDTAAVGASEHHTGYAFDMGIYENAEGKTSAAFLDDTKYSWISKNAFKYGFVQRYKNGKSSITGIVGEPWHYRYVGLPHSIIMEAKGFCLEEYISFLKNCPYDGEHLKIKLSENFNYEIYYIKPSGLFSKGIYIPKYCQYQISGDNKSGYIVTVNLNSKTT